MIDPNIMDETLGIDRTKIASRYQNLTNPNETHSEQQPPAQEEVAFVPPQQEQQPINEEDVNSDNVGFVPFNQPAEPEEPERPKLGRPGKAFGQDAPIFVGGPLQSEIIAWKKQFGKIYSVELDGDIYIWRCINRFEYKEVMSVPNTNELMREEMICEVCVLFPYEYSYETMVNGPGGVPSLLAEQIMQKSGFTRRAKINLL